MKLRIPTLNTITWYAGTAGVVALVALLVWLFRPNSIDVINHRGIGGSTELTSPITGGPCPGIANRAIAVMLSSDKEARPLSGIGQADIVFEIPVTPNGITRMMAVYQCNDPKEVGSIRSARGSFIPLVQGLDPIYVHWGGERDVEAQLKAHLTDDVDCLIYDGTTCTRKKGIPAPHDGFSTMSLIRAQARALGYAASMSLPAFPHTDTAPPRTNLASLAPDASISWPLGMDVLFHYDPATNTYLRSRGGTPETDATTGAQVRVSVVVVMHTTATFLYDQYTLVQTVGAGPADIYQNGQQVSARWSKPSATAPLQFLNAQGKPVPLVVGGGHDQAISRH